MPAERNTGGRDRDRVASDFFLLCRTANVVVTDGSRSLRERRQRVSKQMLYNQERRNRRHRRLSRGIGREKKKNKRKKERKTRPVQLHIQESARSPTIQDLPVQGPIHSHTQSAFYESATALPLGMRVSGSRISSSILQ
jgi:hypothetical protein